MRPLAYNVLALLQRVVEQAHRARNPELEVSNNILPADQAQRGYPPPRVSRLRTQPHRHAGQRRVDVCIVFTLQGLQWWTIAPACRMHLVPTRARMTSTSMP